MNFKHHLRFSDDKKKYKKNNGFSEQMMTYLPGLDDSASATNLQRNIDKITDIQTNILIQKETLTFKSRISYFWEINFKTRYLAFVQALSIIKQKSK